MHAPLAALLLIAAAAPAGAPPADKAQDEPLLVAHPDGSWTITRPVTEAAPTLALVTRELLVEEPEFAAGPVTRDALRDEALDEQAEDAFEDAVEDARRDERPD